MSKVNNQRGDTLVEVILALVILSTVLVSSLSLARLSRSQSTNSSARLQSVNLLQEQYEALRSFRDSSSWNSFASGIMRANESDSANVPASMDCPGGTYCFHMERNRVTGQWVACPGAWHPMLGADTTWNAAGAVAGEGGDPYYITYSGLGCRGDARTTATQRDIAVWIEFNDPAVEPSPANMCPRANSYRFFLHASWSDAGTRTGRSQTDIATFVGNLRGDSLVCS